MYYTFVERFILLSRHLPKSDRYPKSSDESSDTHYLDLPISDSPFIPPVPQRCQSSRFTSLPIKNNFLDVYIEGEQRKEGVSNMRDENQSTFSENNKEPDSLYRKMSALGLGRPPRVHSVELNSFWEARDVESETTSSVEDIYEDTSYTRAYSANASAKVHDTDEALVRKAKEADEMLAHLSKGNFESDRFKLKGV